MLSAAIQESSLQQIKLGSLPAWSNTLIQDLSELASRTLIYQDQARQGNSSHYQKSYLDFGF